MHELRVVESVKMFISRIVLNMKQLPPFLKISRPGVVVPGRVLFMGLIYLLKIYLYLMDKKRTLNYIKNLNLIEYICLTFSRKITLNGLIWS